MQAFIFDIMGMKETGFHMIRKHIKIEPERFYFHCDRLGMIVWQDMVNGGRSYKDWYVTYLATVLSFLQIKSNDRHRKLLSREDVAGQREWQQEMLETIALLKNIPASAHGLFSTRAGDSFRPMKWWHWQERRIQRA